MDLDDELDALHGANLARSAMLSALIAVLREKGVLTPSEVDTIFDVALTGTEGATGLSEGAHRHARRIVEAVGQELCSRPRSG